MLNPSVKTGRTEWGKPLEHSELAAVLKYIIEEKFRKLKSKLSFNDFIKFTEVKERCSKMDALLEEKKFNVSFTRT